MKADRQQYEHVMNEQLRELANNCAENARKELDTIGSVIQKHSAKLNGDLAGLESRLNRSTAQFDETLNLLEERLKRLGKSVWKRSLGYFLLIILTLLVICGGNLGLMRYQSGKIVALNRQLETLRQQEQARLANLAALESKGGKMQLNHCGGKAGQAGRLCVKIDQKAGTYGANGEIWVIPEGY